MTEKGIAGLKCVQLAYGLIVRKHFNNYYHKPTIPTNEIILDRYSIKIQLNCQVL